MEGGVIKTILITGIFATSSLGGAYIAASPGAQPAAGAVQSVAVRDVPGIRAHDAACAQHVWPYYSSACMPNSGRSGARAKVVRVVTTDRVSIA
jgi:hypothetical protein